MYFNQPIFSLPDLTKMKVSVKVHESVVKKVLKGQSAGILIDALQNQPLTGHRRIGSDGRGERRVAGGIGEGVPDGSLD